MPSTNHKSVLARLLANENISVEQTNHPTAYFDVTNRVLGLPHWKDISDDLYGLLIGHEVGHALETPADGWHNSDVTIPGCPRDYVNIVEDIRIEKLILRRYPGLYGQFLRGYQNLLDRDFFGLSGKSVAALPFMDRLNIFSKARGLTAVPFTPAEQACVDLAMGVETWDDVIRVCGVLRDFVKAQGRKSSANFANTSVTVSMPFNTDAEATETVDQTSVESLAGGEGASGNSGDADFDASDEVATDRHFRNAMAQTLVDSVALGSDTIHAKGPTEVILRDCVTSYASLKADRVARGAYKFNTDGTERAWDEGAMKNFLDSEKDIREKVSVMIKEFEMRKAAFRSSRARVSDKGSLDVNKLHRYKFDDHLFKQVTQLADTQSHGMLMLIDYSASMSRVLPKVLKQLLTLVTFCKGAHIPFEVYGFTSRNKSDVVRDIYVDAKMSFVDMRACSVFKLIDSDMSRPVYDEAYKFLYLQSQGYRYNQFSGVESLSGTPLNEALLCMLPAIERLKTRHHLQKMILVTLTDGEAQKIEVYYGHDVNSNTFNKAAVKKLAIDMPNHKIVVDVLGGAIQARAILDEFRQMGVQCINYHLVEHARAKRMSSSRDLTHAELGSALVKTGVAVRDSDAGYDRRFFIKADSAAILGITEDMYISADASVRKITQEFGKYTSSRKNNQLLAIKFAETVA